MKILSRRIIGKLQRANKIVFLVSALIIAAVAVPVYFSLIRPGRVRATWYNSSWGYRAPITIVNNGSVQTNYTVEVVVDTKSLQNAGKLQADCDDVRFTGSSGTSLLSFFTDYCSSTSGVNSSFFVKVSSIAASGNTTIYFYYGNSGATSGVSSYSTVGYPSSVVLGTGKDGAITLSGNTNINTTSLISGRSCNETGSYDGDAPVWTSTATTANGTSNITLVETPQTGCLAAGDEVFIFNAQGNSTSTGTGIYEFARVSSIASNVISLNHPLTNTYNGTDMKIMVQRVPNYINVTTGANALTPSTWNGTSGGVVAFRASGNVTVNATGSVNANGSGYRGGVANAIVSGNASGGSTGESYDGPSTGGGGNACGSAGCADGATRGGGKSGDAAVADPANGAVTGGGGGGGAEGSAGGSPSSTGGGGGGGGGGHAGGGGGGGSNGDDPSPPGATGGNGGSGSSVNTAAGGGGGSVLDTSGAASNGVNGGFSGISGSSSTGTGGSGGSGSTQGAGGGGANNTNGSGPGGGGGGYYGNAALSALYFGSGGGGGGGSDNATNGTAGGAGGGIVLVSSNNVTVSGNITAYGANSTQSAYGGNGGGGAGGSVLIKNVTDNLGSSLVVSTGGNGGGAGQQIADGGDGGDGRIHVDQTDTSNVTTSPTANISRVPSVGATEAEQLYADYAIISEPSVYLPFDEGTGTTTRDMENTGSTAHNGTLSGTILPTWQTEDMCVAGRCLYFEKSSKVSLAGSTNIRTVSFWIRPRDVANIAIFDFDGSTGIVTDGHGTVNAAGITSPVYYLNGHQTSAPTLVAGQWQHLAVTTGTDVPTEAMVVGTQGTTYYVGYIDELRLSSTQKTADEIAAIYNGRGNYKGASLLVGDAHRYSYLSDSLVGYWKMDASGATTAAGIDYSGGQSGLKFASGSAYTQGKYGFGAQLQEGRFSFLTESSARLDNVKTISFWVKPDTSTNYFMSLNEASIQSSGGLVTTTGLSNAKVYVNGAASSAISTGAWQQVTVTTDSALNSTSGDPIPDLMSYGGSSGYYSAISCVTDDDCKMAWYNATDSSLRFMDCDDPTCSSGAVQILDGAPGCVIHGGDGCNVNNDAGNYLAMYCVATDDCKIVYEGGSVNAVFMIDCNDVTCSSGTLESIDGVGCSLTSCNVTSSTNFDKSIYCPTTDDCKIDWYNNDGLRFADCDNATCTTGSVRMLDGAASGNALSNSTTGFVGSNNDIYCPTADDCKLTYTGPGLMFADCSNAQCSAGQIYTLDGVAGCTLSGGDSCNGTRSVLTDRTSISCPSASDCKISYSVGDVMMADCDTANCTSGSVEVVDGNTGSCGLTNCVDINAGVATGISCTATDNCKIGYYDYSTSTSRKPKIAVCTNATCSAGAVYYLDGISSCILKGGDGCTNGTTNATQTIDVNCPSGGTCKVAYYNGYNSALIMGSCGDATCTNGSAEHIEGFKVAKGLFASIDCPAADDCKMAYLSDRAAVMFMDCDNAACSSGTTRVIDADIGCTLTGGDGCSTTRLVDGYLDLDCPAADDCKVVYYSYGDTSFLFADCDDATCSTGSVEILDGAASCKLTSGEGCSSIRDAGFYPTIECPTASNCKVTYFNDTVNSTMFGDCDDAKCSTGSTETIDGSGCGLTNCSTSFDMRVGFIYCPASDDCKVSYHDYSNGDLRFADCTGETCATGTVQVVDGNTGALTGGNTTASLGDWNSLYCPAADNCKIAYRSSTNTMLKFADCDDAQCDTGTINALDGDTTCVITGGDHCDTGTVAGVYPMIICPTSDNCKIIEQDATNFKPQFIDCDNEQCSAGTLKRLDGWTGCTLTGGDICSDVISTGDYAWMSCPTASDCKVSYYDNSNEALQFGDCGDETCSSGSMYYADMGYDMTVMIGRVGESNYMDGAIDEVRLYSREFTQPEIQSLYQSAPGPVGWWKMDEGSWVNDCATGSVTDSSGMGVNGRSCPSGVGPTKPGVGKYGSAGDLTGASDYITVPDGTAYSTNTFTVEGWIKRTVDTEASEEIFSKRDASGDGYRLQVGAFGNDEITCTYNSATVNSTTFLSPLGTWDYVTCTSDGSALRVFINGVLAGETSITGDISVSTNARIGEYSYTTGGNIQAFVDDFRLYNYARTPVQVVEDMNAGHPAPGSPVGSYAGYWDFNEAGGTLAHDQSVNAKHLTVNTSDWSISGKFGGAFVAGRGARDAAVSNATQNETYDFAASDDFTVSAWAKSTAAGNPGSSEAIVGKSDASAGYAMYFDTSGHACLGITDNATFPKVSTCSTGDFYDAAWHHILGVRDVTADKVSIFVDGMLRSSVTDNTTATLDNAQSLRIGQRTAADDGDEFQGLIDDVRIYRSALTADQVKLEFNRAASLSLGSISTQADGMTATNSADAAFCIPGDSSFCAAPAAWWKFDENGGITAGDSSGNSYNGTLANGPQWVIGRNNSAALLFDGASGLANDDTVNTALSANWATMTFEAWIKPQSLGESSAGRIADNTNWTILTQATNTINFQRGFDGGAGAWVLGSDAFTRNVWQHLAISYNAANANNDPIMYINGAPQTLSVDGNGAGTFTSSASNTTIGNDLTGARTFDGYIDDVRIYSYIRTPAQVAWDYNRGAPIAWYMFDECTGNTTYNAAPAASGKAAGMDGAITIGAAGTQNKTGTCTGNSTEAWYNGATGKFNSGLNFDGNDDFVTVTDNATLDITGDFTISAWVKKTASGVMHIVSKSNGTDGAYDMEIFSVDTLMCMTANGGTPSLSVSANNVVTSGSGWHHTAVVRSGASCRTFVDGLDRTATIGTHTTVSANNNNLFIGQRPDGAERWQGQIDDVRIYNYALTKTQLQNVYNNAAAVRFAPISGAPTP